MCDDADTLVFDAGKLHEQLAGLLQLYLKRASDPDAVQQCSAKDALACAKALTAMMSDAQSGKPASVDSSVGRPFTGRRPDTGTKLRRGVNPRPTGSRPTTENQHLPATPQVSAGPTTILEDALSIVLASEEEIQIPEPYKRLIARIEKLCKETRKRLDAAQSDDPSVGRPFTGRRHGTGMNQRRGINPRPTAISPADDRRLKTDDCFT